MTFQLGLSADSAAHGYRRCWVRPLRTQLVYSFANRILAAVWLIEVEGFRAWILLFLGETFVHNFKARHELRNSFLHFGGFVTCGGECFRFDPGFLRVYTFCLSKEILKCAVDI